MTFEDRNPYTPLPGIGTGYSLSVHIITQGFSSMVDTCSNIDLKQKEIKKKEKEERQTDRKKNK